MKIIKLSRHHLTFIVLTITFSFAFAQEYSKAIFFTENEEKFILTLNDARQNEDASSRVDVDRLKGKVSYKVLVQFENASYQDLNKSINLEPKTITKIDIVKNKKGKFGLVYKESKPYTVHTISTPKATHKPKPEFNGDLTIAGDKNNVTTTTTYMEESGRVNPEGENVVTKTITHADGSVETFTTTTSSASTTETTTTSYEESGHTEILNDIHDKCSKPMSLVSYQEAKKSIVSKPFEKDKIVHAKQIITSHCPTSIQIKGIIKILKYESSRIEIAKYAYDHCYDPPNYYQLNDGFEYGSSIETMKAFVEENRK